MRERCLEVAYGVSPCAKGNHTLRTRAGHCFQCNPANIRFQNRHTETAFLYLAVSKDGGVVKFGVTQDIADRQISLVDSAYGGYHDWEIIAFSRTEEAGKIEHLIHSEVSHLRVYAEYFKGQKVQSAYEVLIYHQKRQRYYLTNIQIIRKIIFPKLVISDLSKK